MSKSIRNSIKLGQIQAFKILAILAFSLLIIPAQVSAASYGRNVSFEDLTNQRETVPPSSPVEDYSYGGQSSVNPKPVIYTLTPKGENKSTAPKTITINGRNFIPSSVARINGANRPTTFIDSTRLLVSAGGNDMYRTDGGFYVTVYNSEPGGGFSNSEFFAVKNVAMINGADNNYYDPYGNQNVPAEDFSSLTSNAVYGSNAFLPSGAVQWILFAIAILLIVILARKYFGGEEAYHATPLKHD